MSRIPGISKYRNWLNQQTLPGFRVSEIIELGAFWTETTLSDEKTGKQFWARLYHIESHKEEALKSLWQDFAYTLEGLNEDFLQTPVGLKKVGNLTAYLSEFEEGIDIKSLLKNSGHLKANRAIILLLQTIKSLETVYARGAAHFQLKPSNLILKPDGQILVKNFGLYEMENLFGRQIGSQHMWDVAYFSPEHFGDQELTIASDIYSLGLVLFEMVTGKQPFFGQYQDVMTAQMKSMPPNPQALNPEVNIGLARVMLRMLAKKKEQRFQSFSELRQALFLLLSPLEQAIYRSFTLAGDSALDDTEAMNLKTGFAQVNSQKIHGDSQAALSSLEGLIRMYGVRQEFKEIAIELADMIHHDELELLIQKADEYLQNGYPFKAINTTEEILSIHPFHTGARSVFRKAYSLLDYRPLLAQQPAIAIDLHLKLANESKDEKALFAFVRVLLSDPRNEQAINGIELISGNQDPIDQKLDIVRNKRDQGDFTEALALLDSFLTQNPNNRRALMLKKQISEQIHIMSMGKINESGATIPISIDGDIDDNFSIDPEEQNHLEEGVLNIQIAIQSKELDAAEKELSALVKAYPNDPALNELIQKLRLERQAEKISAMEERLKQLIEVGDDNGSSALVRDILQLDPAHSLAKATLANLEKKREDNSASSLLRKEVEAIEKRGDFSEALHLLKQKMEKQPRTQELMNLEKRLAENVQLLSERDWLLSEAQSMISNGNFPSAQEKLNKVFEKFPQDAKALSLQETLKTQQSQPPMPQTPPTPTVAYNTIPGVANAPAPPAAPAPPVAPPSAPVTEEQVEAGPVNQPKPPKSGTKNKLLIPIIAIVIIVIGACVGGFLFYKKGQKDDRLLEAFNLAADIESQGDWEGALVKWRELAEEAPEFKDSLGRLRNLESQIQAKKDRIAGLLTSAKGYQDDGYYYDDSQQNAIVVLRKIFELDPENAEAKAIFLEIRGTEMQTAGSLFDEDRILEARDKYATVKLIDPTFSDPAFEERVDDWIQETLVTPALVDIEKAIKRKKWDKALELSEDLRQKVDPVPPLDSIWDVVFNDLQEKVVSETKKTKILKLLDLMTRIHPDDQTLIIEKNELNRELNQAQLDKLFQKMERAYKKKQLITTGTQAKKLLALDSEHELAKERLYEVIGKLKNRAEAQAKDNPTKSIATYRSLLQIENAKSHRRAIAKLQAKLNRFNTSIEKVHQSMNKPYDQLSKAVAQAIDRSQGFEKEKNFTFLQNLKSGIEVEQKNILKIVTWEKAVRDDTSKTYASILGEIKKRSGFKYAFAKQQLARMTTTYEDKIKNYTGDLTVVIRSAKNLPKSQGLRKTPDAFAQLVVGSTTCSSESVKGTAPVWNHICQFHINAGEEMIFSLYNKGFVKKQTLIGSLRLPTIPKTGKNQKFTSPKGWTIIVDIRRAR